MLLLHNVSEIHIKTFCLVSPIEYGILHYVENLLYIRASSGTAAPVVARLIELEGMG